MKPLIKLFLLFSAAFCWVPADAENTLTIYYTSSLNGNLDGCTCDMNPVAGLVKRAAFLRALEHSGPTLILDAGDIYDEYPDPDLDRHILEVYEELNYDAIAVGDQEIPSVAANTLEYKTNSPLICHNLLIQNSPPEDAPSEEKARESLVFTPGPVVVESKGLRIGILSLIDPATVPLPSDKGIRIADPIPVAEMMLKRYGQMGLDATVLLYHGPFRSAEQLVNACPGIDVAIFAHEQRLVAPRKIGSALLASPGEEGNQLGILTLHLSHRGIENFESNFRFFSYEEDPDDPAVRSRIDTYRQKLRSLLY
jgi:2',3'-cyclic-nucleotide 2'-phosphodiesterase (5'-nucleotidase family)